MPGSHAGNESHALRGVIDRAALCTIRDVVLDTEPLATAELDDVLNPTVVKIEFDDGLGDAERARIDARWTTNDDYAFHYTDEQDLNLRWGRHPHDDDYGNVSGLAHYHPPPDATASPTDVEQSCIRHQTPRLVTRAVLTLWRRAYHEGALTPLNAGQDPP